MKSKKSTVTFVWGHPDNLFPESIFPKTVPFKDSDNKQIGTVKLELLGNQLVGETSIPKEELEKLMKNSSITISSRIVEREGSVVTMSELTSVSIGPKN